MVVAIQVWFLSKGKLCLYVIMLPHKYLSLLAIRGVNVLSVKHGSAKIDLKMLLWSPKGVLLTKKNLSKAFRIGQGRPSRNMVLVALDFMKCQEIWMTYL